jgi:hypothetical protein
MCERPVWAEPVTGIDRVSSGSSRYRSPRNRTADHLVIACSITDQSIVHLQHFRPLRAAMMSANVWLSADPSGASTGLDPYIRTHGIA